MSSDWVKCRLDDVIHVKHGFAFKSEFFAEEPTSQQLVTPGNFAIGGGFQLGKGKFYSGPVPEEYVLKKGDVVVTMTDLSRGADTLGYAAVVPETTGTTWLHNQRVGLVQIKDFDAVDSGFLHYLMRSPEYRHWVIASATGSTVKHTAPSRICNFEFMLPPICEQRSISTSLGALDDRITLLRETNTTLEAIAQALFKSWFVDFDPVLAKQEGRAPEGMDEATAGLFPDGFEESDLGLVPKGWQTEALYSLAEFINGAAYKVFEPNLERRGLPIVKIAELKAGVTAQTAFSDVEMPQKYRLKAGDILFSWSGNPDTSIDTFVWSHDDALLNQHIFKVVPRGVEDRSFILPALKHLKPVFTELARNKQTTGLGHVTVADLKRLRIAKPAPKILAAWCKIISPILDLALGVTQQAQILASLRDTLLPRLISGQLRLKDTSMDQIT